MGTRDTLLEDIRGVAAAHYLVERRESCLVVKVPGLFDDLDEHPLHTVGDLARATDEELCRDIVVNIPVHPSRSNK